MEDRYSLTNVSLEDNRYEIEQNLIRNKYNVSDMSGNIVLKGKQKMLKMREEFPFVTGDGQDAFTIKAESIMDVAGDYKLIDSATDKEILIIDEDLTFLTEKWTIRDIDDGSILATIESENKVLSALRHLSSLANLVPNKYEIFNPEGEKIGGISGEFSLRDKYIVHIDTSESIPREAVMASACVIDALENK